jgi:hypothetical protein
MGLAVQEGAVVKTPVLLCLAPSERAVASNVSKCGRSDEKRVADPSEPTGEVDVLVPKPILLIPSTYAF